MKTFEERAGDVCVYNVSKNYTHLVWDKVARSTATLIVTENGRRFNRDGRELKSDKSSYPCARLWTVEQARDHEKHEDAANTRKTAVRDLEQALAGRRTGHGEYHISDEALATIKQLTAVLKNQS